ncbi:MAG: MarR family transcriptional regulator [Rickettsiales bacterium]|jgi:DNA-binding MarR family transcriptional regulator|nr:MarR family transcriptional regulator [Rickettsiales bacterium]
MPQKEFIDLIEKNMTILDRLNGRIKCVPNRTGYSKQQFQTLIRLYLGGRARLKDIAKREMVPASNLCLVLKTLEKDGLVLRQVDDSDRRNTWYSLTASGEKLAKDVICGFKRRIAEIFAGLEKKDEEKLTAALRTMNELLNKIKGE